MFRISCRIRSICTHSCFMLLMSRCNNSRCIVDWFSIDCFCPIRGVVSSRITSLRCFSTGRTNQYLLPQYTTKAINNIAPAITKYDAHIGNHCSSHAASAIARKMSPITTMAVIITIVIIRPINRLVCSMLFTCSNLYCVLIYSCVSVSN